MSIVIAAWTFAVAACVVVLFQLALAVGAPWGHLAMGGRIEGKFPPAMRVGAIVQALMLMGMAGIVCSHADILPYNFSAEWNTGIWVVVVVSGVSLILNVITPSRQERALWAPVALVMFAASLIVAMA